MHPLSENLWLLEGEKAFPFQDNLFQHKLHQKRLISPRRAVHKVHLTSNALLGQDLGASAFDYLLSILAAYAVCTLG